MTDEPRASQVALTPSQEEADALRRIAATHDGALFHRYLRRVLETVIDLESDGALRQQNGRRSLARDIMRLMAEGLDDRHDRNDNAAILTRSGGAVAVSGRARRDPARFARVDSYPDHLNSDGSDPRAGSDKPAG